jgi:hypothetical protein
VTPSAAHRAPPLRPRCAARSRAATTAGRSKGRNGYGNTPLGRSLNQALLPPGEWREENLTRIATVRGRRPDIPIRDELELEFDL